MRALLAAAEIEGPVVDDAALVVTELVANAVLHAGGPVGLRVGWTDDDDRGLRLEVTDGSPAPPIERSYGTGASTGRGIALVARVAHRWGVDRTAGGKTVWAELVVDGSSIEEAWAAPVSTMPQAAGAALPPGSVAVHYLAVPVAGYLRLQEQNDAILRELELLAFTADHAGDIEPSPRLIDVIERSRQHFNAVREGFRAAVVDAAEAGRTSIDLDGTGAPSGLASARDFVALLEDVERLAADGELLVSPPDPEVAHLRRWFVDEMTAQVEGRPPTAFSM